MELSTFLILLILAIIFITIGFMIPDTKYKIAYFMIIALLWLSVLNIYLSVVYYIQLRNDPGIPGPQGSKGPQGAKGPPGKCSFSEKCGIQDARTKILDIAHQMYSIPQTCLDNPSIDTCGNQETLESAMPINNQINMLEQIAYSTTMAERDFLDKIRVCVQDSDQCMNPNEF
jgi:hypothetical protein